MNKKALFCDGTSQYVNPSEPERNEEVVFRFRTAKDDAEHVCLVQEKIRYEMEKAQTGEVPSQKMLSYSSMLHQTTLQTLLWKSFLFPKAVLHMHEVHDRTHE